jgi:hypothetical protein
MVEYVLTTTHVVSVTGLVANALRGIVSQALHGVTSHLQQVGPNARGFSNTIVGVPAGVLWIGLFALLIGLVLTRNR